MSLTSNDIARFIFSEHVPDANQFQVYGYNLREGGFVIQFWHKQMGWSAKTIIVDLADPKCGEELYKAAEEDCLPLFPNLDG